MVKTKIAVLVSGGGTNLQALLDAQAAGRTIPAPRSGQPWYDGYLRYCEQQGIFQASELGESYERAITRAELAQALQNDKKGGGKKK